MSLSKIKFLSPLSLTSLFIFVSLSFLFFATPVYAAKFDASSAAGFAKQANTEVGADEIEYTEVAARIAKAAFSIGGIIFFLLIFYGGYTWLMARGEEEEITKAQNIIIGAIIGLFIMVGSYAITNFVLSRMIGGGSGSPATSGPPAEPTGPLGCCLNEVQAPSSIWDIGSTHHWNSEITDEETCVTHIKTCTKEDELCESQNGSFIPNITDADECWAVAQKTPTN
ncbi:MAG: hypothetical protein HY569_02650 [Candidatus Magasanikbacteria bacterium]|nr:hypothetical protein [Candidatus Magasanikbacteria bacterium]